MTTPTTTRPTVAESCLRGMEILKPILSMASTDRADFMLAAFKLAKDSSDEDLASVLSLAKVASDFVEALIITKVLIEASDLELDEAGFMTAYKEAKASGVLNKS